MLSQQVSGTKMRNEKRQGLYKHSPYSVAHVDLEIHLVCLYCHIDLNFGVKAKDNQNKVPTSYCLPELHKNPYKARFIANSSSCTTTELSKLLTSCLTAVKKHAIKYCAKVYERSGKNYFGLLKIQVKGRVTVWPFFGPRWIWLKFEYMVV